jgi:hypothetical protein
MLLAAAVLLLLLIEAQRAKESTDQQARAGHQVKD